MVINMGTKVNSQIFHKMFCKSLHFYNVYDLDHKETIYLDINNFSNTENSFINYLSCFTNFFKIEYFMLYFSFNWEEITLYHT